MSQNYLLTNVLYFLTVVENNNTVEVSHSFQLLFWIIKQVKVDNV